MKTYTVRFYRSFGEDCEAVAGCRRSLLSPGGLRRQLGREFMEATTHGLARGAFRSLDIGSHRFAKNDDTYGLIARIASPLSLPRFVRALQGLYDRGMAGEFVVVE